MVARIQYNPDRLAEFCRRQGIARLALFGSVLRDDFDPDRSDVDVLVYFRDGAPQPLTYFRLARLGFELERLFGCRVDLSMGESLDRYLRDGILASAEVHYDAA